MGLFKVKKNGSVTLSRHIDSFYKSKLDAKNSSNKAEQDEIFDEIFGKIPPSEKDPACYLLQFFGFMLAKVLSTDTVAGIDLDPMVFKYLQGNTPEWKDVQTWAPSFYKTAEYFMSKAMTSDDMISFSVPIKVLKQGKKVVEIFKLKNPDEDVTDVNKHEYLDLYFQKKYMEPISKYLNAIKTGFFMVFPKDMASLMTPQDLKLLVCGQQVVTLNDVKRYAKLPTTTDKSYETVANQFWTTMEKLDSDQLKKFLYFISGNSHIPYNFSGNFNIAFSLTKNRAPTAGTCGFNGTFNLCDSQQLFEKLFFCAIEGGHWGYDQTY
jgi:hypothetical protein